MHVITKTRLLEFGRRHPNALPSLRGWLAIMKRARYANSAEVRRDFASASFLGEGKTVFNIAGNRYRLVVDIRYRVGRVHVRHVLTHAEYDRLSATDTL